MNHSTNLSYYPYGNFGYPDYLVDYHASMLWSHGVFYNANSFQEMMFIPPPPILPPQYPTNFGMNLGPQNSPSPYLFIEEIRSGSTITHSLDRNDNVIATASRIPDNPELGCNDSTNDIRSRQLQKRKINNKKVQVGGAVGIANRRYQNGVKDNVWRRKGTKVRRSSTRIAHEQAKVEERNENQTKQQKNVDQKLLKKDFICVRADCFCCRNDT